MSSENNNNQDDDIKQQKKVLRKQVRVLLKDLSKDDITVQSNQVWNRLFELPEYQTAKSIGLFLSMPQGEINTDPVILNAVQNGKNIYVPQVGKNFEQCDMELRKVVVTKATAKTQDDNSELLLFHKAWPHNKWNIPEPPEDMPIVLAQPGDIDLLIVPGLAFDSNGNRLGQGKGYYDRFISRMKKGASLPLVAVCLSCQVVDNVPMAEYDFQMDKVITPTDTFMSAS